MRICTFAMMLPVHISGGMEYHSWTLLKELAERGNDVVAITGRHPQGIEYEVKNGVKIYYVGFEKANSRYPVSYWKESIKKFEELNKEKRFDIIHSQSVAAWYYITKNLKRKYKIPFIATMHGTSAGEIKSGINQKSIRGMAKVLFHILSYSTLGLKFVRSCDAIIAVSDDVAREIKTFFFVKPDKVYTIPNGIDTTLFNPNVDGSEIRKRYNIGEEKLIFAVGRLEKEKGFQYLIDAFSLVLNEIKDVRLIIAGIGKYEDKLRKQIETSDLTKNVMLCGNVENEELPRYYNSCDIFVNPTVRVEGLPLIIPEAMACGKPVIASRIGGIPTVIDDGINGFLFPPGDCKSISENIIRLLKNQELRYKIGKNARIKAESGFSSKRMADDTLMVMKIL